MLRSDTQLKKASILSDFYNPPEQASHIENRFHYILEILQYDTFSVREFLDFALSQAIKLTESKMGYILHYNEQNQEFIVNTWSQEAMRLCSIDYKPSVFHLDETGIWGDAVRYRKPIIINNYHKPNPSKKGIPEGHAPVDRFMEIPVFRGKQIVAVVAVANKKAEYSQTDVIELSLLMNSIWKSVDIKAMEEALIDNEHKYRTVFENSGTATAIIEANMIISLANKNFCKLFGYAKHQIENQRCFFDFVAKKDIPKIYKYYPTSFETLASVPSNIEFQGIGENGRIMNLLVSFAAIPSSGKVVASIVDISDRRRMELELHNTNTILEQIYAAIPSIIISMLPNGEITNWNPGAEKVLGIKTVNALGRKCLTYL